MKRIWVLVPLVILLAVVGVALGQEGPGASFATELQIGRPRPRGVQYDPNFDQIAWVDAQGRLALVDAATFQVKYILYEQGLYSIYRFSHDGRWLALGIDRRVELWDTQTGSLAATAEPGEALRIQAPLQFADDDKLLLITAVVPAPAALRRSENDTSLLPYLWDLPAALDEAPTTLPRQFELYTFYDYRNGFVLGAHDKVIAALPRRLQVIDVADKNLPVLAEIPSERAEGDPISIWYSLRGDYIYVLPQGSNNFVQVDTAAGTTFEIPLERDLGYRDIRALDGLKLSDQARIVGEPNSRQDNAFLNLLLGSDYRARFNYHPLTVTILDLVDPITVDDLRKGFLVYVLDEQTGRAVIEALRLYDVQQLILHPDNRHIAVRRASEEQAVEVYDLATGALVTRFIPALPDLDASQLFAYDKTGDVILCGFQRFDANTGDVLHENLSYNTGFEQYFFTQDSQKLVTLNGSEWWLWDLNTGEVIQREHFSLRGTLLQMSPDAHRFMTQLDLPEGRGIEVLDVGTGERRSVIFKTLPGRPILDVLPSPTWEHFIVIYDIAPYGPYYPGNEIAIYSLSEGLQWFLAGDDLPYPENRSYGWLDNDTVYVYGENLGGAQPPARMYGVDYDTSGLPACLVQAFPADWMRWRDLWQRLSLTIRADRLNALALRLCAAHPETENAVEAIFYPSPTPTSLPVTATPAVIAGVPACLTNRFPREAAEYAQVWREMSAGLDPEQAKELEILLCEGLDTTPPDSAPGDADTAEDAVRVMTIDIHTGVRAVGGYLPQQPRPPVRSLDLVIREFERTTSRILTDPVLSPDGTRLAARAPSNHVMIYRLLTPYETLAENATATAAPRADETWYISVRPTATQPFDREGVPRPTLTPTMTPTAPPRADQSAGLPRQGEIEDLCLSETLDTLDALPLDYAPSGDVLVRLRADSAYVWRLNPATGALRPDDTLPSCLIEDTCIFSFDRTWIVWPRDSEGGGEGDGENASRDSSGIDIIVSHVDGSAARTLADIHGSPLTTQWTRWLGAHTLEYHYYDYRLDLSRDPVEMIRQIDPVSGALSDPFRPPDPVRIIGLDAEVIAEQPDGGPLVVARLRFNTGSNDGYMYYLYNRDTGTADYFARLAEYPDNTLSTSWHPLGDALFYVYPDGDKYVYDVATGEHRRLDYPSSGVWSPDGRYMATWISLSGDERQERLDAGLPLPKLAVWDRDTGLTRRACIPDMGEVDPSARLTWSPDSRYLVFQTWLPVEGDEMAPLRALALDTQTGHAVALSVDVDAVIAWVE